MSTTARNTGTHFRFDNDEQLWKAKMRLQVITDGVVRVEEFITKVATILELIAWITDVLASVAARPGATVAGGGDIATLKATLADLIAA
jgi:hypothetical protein